MFFEFKINYFNFNDKKDVKPLSTVHIIKQLANRKNMSFAELEREIGLSNGTIARWGKASPNSKGLEAVADYFNVSVDYLLGREKTQEDEYEQQLVAMFRKQTDGMNDSQKEKFNKSLDKLFSVAEVLLSDEDNWKGD